MAELIPRLDPEGTWSDVREWLRSMAPVLGAVQREATFWLELMVRDLGETDPEPPEGRVGDVMGWLELLHAPGSHLVVCGMNEGQVPASPGADPWPTDSASRRSPSWKRGSGVPPTTIPWAWP